MTPPMPYRQGGVTAYIYMKDGPATLRRRNTAQRLRLKKLVLRSPKKPFPKETINRFPNRD
jgi:hypothetical protein